MQDCIVEKDGKQFVDVVKLLPEALPSGKKILWKQVNEEKVEIFVDKKSARGGNAKPIVVSRLIPISELLFEGLGLRFGDGIKFQGGELRVFGFSNTNLNLHKHFLKFSRECLGLEFSQFKVRISVPPKLKDKILEIEENISKELGIHLENFFKPQILERRNLFCIDIKINSTLLGIILNNLFHNLKDTLFQNRVFIASFLRGVIACEGNIFLRKGVKLDEINIAVHRKVDRKFIRDLLTGLGIQPNKDKEIEHDEAILIHGLSNFRKIKEWNLVSLHPAKFQDFEKGLCGFQKEEFRKGEAKFLILKSLKEKSKRSIELTKELNRTQKDVGWNLRKLQKMKLVEKERKSVNIFWNITEKGLEVLDCENPLEKLRWNS